MDQDLTGRASKIILVVDSDRDRLQYTHTVLSGAGYRVLTATSAEVAEALANTDQTIDLIICSVVLGVGGLSGVDLAEYIERSDRTNSTLLVSHYSRDLLHSVPGFDSQPQFLANPFDSQELLSRVRELLSMKERRDLKN